MKRDSSLGIDVSERRGLDLVLLESGPRLLGRASRVAVEDLPRWLERWRPDLVAIDGPPKWGRRGGSRRAERELLRLGIRSYATPSDPSKRERPFYAWMKRGFQAFAVCRRSGYPPYRRGQPRRHALEVFPHASAVFLAGALPPRTASKKSWRTGLLEAHGVPTESLRTQDLVDAALAALTGLRALAGSFRAVGDPAEGVIVVPGNTLPRERFRVGVATPAPAALQLRLPGLSPCRCGEAGCRESTGGEFAPGHDAKRKAWLCERARAGAEATAELRRRGWELPPEQR